MSFNTIGTNTNNQLTVNTDLSKLFLGRNRHETDVYVNNSTYDPIVLPAGTVMGRIASTGILVPVTSTASDGSQFPLGILREDLKLGAGVTQQTAICVSGDVAAEMLTFVKPGDNLNTVVSLRTYRDRIGADTVGVKLVYTVENTAFDNQ